MSVKRPTVSSSKLSVSYGTLQHAGAVDEDMFMAAFEDVPKIQLYSSKDVEEEFASIKTILENGNSDWEKRIEAMQKLRSVIKERGDTEEVIQHLKTIEVAFLTSLKDLRSKVVREACITISYISIKVRLKCERLMECLLPNMINLIQNSVKIMSTSALVGIRFIIQNTHSSRFIPIITSYLSSKSREIRKAVSEFLHQLLLTWPTHTLDKHNALLQNSIKKGIADADAEARSFSRKAFWAYSSHFKEQADILFHSLDQNKQKILHGEHYGTANGLTNSLSTNSLPGTASRSSSSSSIARHCGTNTRHSVINATYQHNRPPLSIGNVNRSGIPIISPKPSLNKVNSPLRTASAIDIGAARAATLRSRGKNEISSITARRRELNGGSISHSNYSPTERTGRQKTRISLSQPNSRSTSPTSRLNYLQSLQSNLKSSNLTSSSSTLSSGRRRSGIPTLSSRETSPARTLERRSSLSKISRPLEHCNLDKKHVSNEKLFTSANDSKFNNLLIQNNKSNDFVDSFNTLLNNCNFSRQGRRLIDDQSDESETSSICSDMSFNSNGRSIEDANEIIRNLASAHWSDRKEGLMGIQYFLRQSSRTFTSEELKKITDIFTKMLVDPHTKTFSFFLEFLGEYLIVYKNELRGWLFILMTRLFLKLGTDTLGSIQTKINRTLDIIQRNFTHQDQFNSIIRFLNDQTQTPTIKTKIIVLQYFHNLLNRMMSNEWLLTNGNDLKISLMKIISWTTDPKSQELRKCSQEVLIDLFNLNTVEYLNVLKQLPNSYQDTACQLTQIKRKFSSDANIYEGTIRRSSLSSNGSKENTVSRRSSSLTRSVNLKNENASEVENSENYNPEQVYNFLKKTTDEIQKYITSMGENVLNNSNGSNGVNKNGNSFENTFLNFESMIHDSSSIKNFNGDFNGNFGGDSNDIKFKKIFQALKIESNSKEEVQKQAYNSLVELINNASENDWFVHFKDTLSLILDKISKDENYVIRAYSLKIMCELLYKRTKFFNSFIELTMLRILEASRDKEKEVQRTAELCAATAAVVLPGDQSIRILKAVIATSQMPVNLAAIKMLTKVVEKQSPKTVSSLLSEIMPPLIQAYDDSESAIRKAAVFCMVAIHNCVGEEINGHLVCLNGSKMKLLKLYIDRSKANTSGSSSPVSISVKSIKSN